MLFTCIITTGFVEIYFKNSKFTIEIKTVYELPKKGFGRVMLTKKIFHGLPASVYFIQVSVTFWNGLVKNQTVHIKTFFPVAA